MRPTRTLRLDTLQHVQLLKRIKSALQQVKCWPLIRSVKGNFFDCATLEIQHLRAPPEMSRISHEFKEKYFCYTSRPFEPFFKNPLYFCHLPLEFGSKGTFLDFSKWGNDTEQ